VGWAVSLNCDQTQWQAVLDATSRAVLYYSDGNPTDLALLYPPSIHLAFTDKSQTYRVEGDKAELRHYLARRSRCFSRCLIALTHAVKLFVYAWNRRPLYKQVYPHYPAHVMAFVYP
jgi:hypothetical protein